MATYDKYQKYQKYINGVPADPPEYMRGELIGTGEYDSKADCESDVLYRWVDNGKTVCKEYSLYNQEKKQKSTDKGVTWTDTNEVRDGNKIIEQYSTKCGWELKTRWEKTGRTVCDGYNLSEEYIKQESWDMGKTWLNSVPGEYKYEVVGYLSKQCILQAEPLTYKVTLNDPQSTISFKTSVSGIANKYYVRWGDAFDYIEEVTISGDSSTVKSHKYAYAGEYTVEIWSIPITIGDIEVTNGTYDIVSWGYSSYVQSESKGYPTSVILEKSYAGSIVEDSHQTFQYLTNFQHHGQRLTVIPPKLFQYAKNLVSSSFSRTSVKIIPSNLYINTNQTNFTSVCQDCKELEIIEQDSFASNKGARHQDIIQYYSGDYPATRCMKCFKEGNMQKALTDCQNVKVTAEYYTTAAGKKVSISYTSPNAEQLAELYECYSTYRYRPFINFADRYLVKSGDHSLSSIHPEWNPRNGVLFTEDEYWVHWNSKHYGADVWGDWSIKQDIDNGRQYFAYSSGIFLYNTGGIGVELIYDSYIFTNAFSGCSKLHTVGHIMNNTQYVASTKYMFQNCTSLQTCSDFLLDYFLGEEVIEYQKGYEIINRSLEFSYMGMFEGCTSLNSPIDISTNTKYVEPFKYIEPLAKLNSQNTTLRASISLDYMYSGSGITQYDNLALSYPSIYNVTSKYMFSNCPNLVSFTNSRLNLTEAQGMFTNSQNLTTVSGINFVNAQSAFKDCVSLTTLDKVTFTGNIEYCFQNCTSLATVPATLFPNDQKDLIANYAFKDCTALTSIPNTLISNTVPAEDKLEIYKMFEHSGLQNYPVDDNKAIWQWKRFYDQNDPSTYKKTLAFYGCMDIIDEVPVRWGGLVDIDKNMHPIILEIDSNTVNLNLSSSDEIIITTNDGQYITLNSGNIKINSDSSPLTLKLYYIDNTWRVTSKTYYKILDFGSGGMIHSDSNPSYITYLGTDQGAFKASTAFPLRNLNVEGVSVDFLKSGTNINSLDNLFKYNTKLTSIPEGTFSKLANLSGADHILEWSNIQNVDGLFEGCANLISAFYAFRGCESLVSAQRTFKDCTKLSNIDSIFGESPQSKTLAVNCNQLFENTGVEIFALSSFLKLSSAVGMFRNNSKLTTIYTYFTLVGDNVDVTEMFKDCPLLNNDENQQVFELSGTANFTRCWQNCTSLSYIPKVIYAGNTVNPWEVPNAVGTQCFNGCTALLQQYGDQIPDGWK